ncbi:MAG TPA: anthranilate phosphoribosyltransferase [Gemmatimonadaceae bacterium]|nr:anthranilate phosphoribosyltransferase [Gemmatimonadaceae bacterium]
MSADPLSAALRRLASGDALSRDEAAAAFDVVMNGEASAARIAALLVGLRVRGETAEEVAGAAQALRNAMVQLPAAAPDALVDTCGTGGGALTTFNISTAAALLAAGAGVRVAKHGNRSFTSRCGSADVLEALGVDIDAPVEVAAEVLERAGIVFMFAPLMHPAMRHVGPVRRELAIPTVMNMVGPLANPAGAGRQVVGVADAARVPLMAGALAVLGSAHALVVYGEPGLDEISPLGRTRVVEVRHGAMREWTIDPAALGLAAAGPEELAGGDPAANAAIVREVLAGQGTPGGRAAVVLNAGAAIYISGLAATYEEGVRRAREACAAGVGLAALERMRQAYAEAADRRRPAP